MFSLCSEITINGQHFGGVNNVTIKRSVYDLAATATIKVPVTAVLKKTAPDGSVTETETETAKAIQPGHDVLIRLGYNGSFNTEFKGKVKQLNLKAPLEIVCEDMFYDCRSRTVSLSGKTTLTEILQKCGLEVAEAATLTLDSFQQPEKTVANILTTLKESYGLVIYFDLDGKVHATKPLQQKGETVKYQLRHNVIKDSDLKYQKAGDVKLKVIATYTNRDGKEVKATCGEDGGAVKNLQFNDIKEEKELQELAKAEYKRHVYDGYDGKIQTFLFPYAAPTMLAQITDPNYSERDGVYYIESVEVSYGTSGARRTIEIGAKI